MWFSSTWALDEACRKNEKLGADTSSLKSRVCATRPRRHLSSQSLHVLSLPMNGRLLSDLPHNSSPCSTARPSCAGGPKRSTDSAQAPQHFNAGEGDLKAFAKSPRGRSRRAAVPNGWPWEASKSSTDRLPPSHPCLAEGACAQVDELRLTRNMLKRNVKEATEAADLNGDMQNSLFRRIPRVLLRPGAVPSLVMGSTMS